MIIKCTNKEGTSIKQLKNLILFQLDPMIYPYELNTLNTQNDRILLQSLFEGKTLKISDGLDGKNLLDYFDAEPIEYGSSPNVNIDILKFHNLTISHIKNKETGEDKSYLRFSLSGVGLLEGENSSNDSSNDSSNNGSSDDFEKEYEKAITKQIVEIPWNSDSIHLDNVEIDFDDRMMYIFINGKLKSIQFLENKFKKTEQTLELLGKKENPYSFDEIIINNKCIHTKDFELDKKQLTKYTTKKPYIDFYFSGNDLKKGMELKALSQSGIECCLCDGGNFYYYSSGAWRRARGSFEDTNDWYLFTDKIKNYDYSGNEFFIRCFFISEGYNNSYIECPYFEIDDASYEDGNGNVAAILVGNKEWSIDGHEIVEDLDGKKLVIITDQGTTNIDFKVENGKILIGNNYYVFDIHLHKWVLISTSIENSSDDVVKNKYYNNLYCDHHKGNYNEKKENEDINMSSDDFEEDIPQETSSDVSEDILYLFDLDTVLEIINSYYPDGIAKCIKDSKDRVVLVSETKGENAFIMVKGDAAPIIFGNVSSANGLNEKKGEIDYTKFYEAVRTYTGSPLISMEVSDEQMKLFLKEALAYYKRWVATDINTHICQLKGDWKNGFEIPTVIESKQDIVDIIFKPVFPISFYGSDFIDNGTENIFTLTFANYLLGGKGMNGGINNISQDYYVSLMGLQDFKQVLGLNPTWDIMNNRLYIYPANVSRYTNVCIKYKAPLSEEDALKNPDMIAYVHGKCLQAMSLIRSQYNGNLSSGDTGLVFDSSWYEKGKTICDSIIELWKKMQPPLGFFL